ncbi:helix-turn-helix transcriptional regulator [Coleofasciculus sp. FACHB-64]|uniref:helix-turn-helix transcriptional regulator n=2 Tax=Cyanobacteriota TaxID=1117 RepID=UPI00168669CC|nr:MULTISPECIES: AraC family transcriptional regulator [unclassified Coleofasciculus]MBD1840842.1 helix-turn-helix transcriptional regulator [Coleofasciculus sp. FACHB-501]MBD1901110.1 helix-turn-helix transcriptional regulator [Coleofasciculus sp. FACHB-125]MBD2047190.1 helix-turn-helix transcriptional regulator [Coleofasciculus sp. FACHB-64]
MPEAQLPNIDLTQEKVWKQLVLNAPVLSSNTSAWSGIHFAYHRQSAHELPECCFAQHIITICVGQFEIRLKRNGHWQSERYTDGDVGIFPANQSDLIAKCDRKAEFINLYLEPATFARVAYESVDADRVEIVPQFKVHDPLIQQIGLSLKTELESGGVDSRLYAESMATALSAHLLQRYSVKRSLMSDYTGGLPLHKLREAIAYINDYLDQDLMLAEIAATVQMSPHYFASLFKQSTGFAPHQYVTKCRIEKAKLLLARQELTIAEILQQVGFKSQSHFTRVFRQYTTTTPKAYRDAL